MIGKIWNKSKLNSDKIWKVQKKNKLNSEKIWNIWKKSQLSNEMIWKIWKKSKFNSEKIWKIGKKNVIYLKGSFTIFYMLDKYVLGDIKYIFTKFYRHFSTNNEANRKFVILISFFNFSTRL